MAHGKAKYQRSMLMHSDELPQILERLEKESPKAKSVLKNYALSTVRTAINAEMDDAVTERTVANEEIGEEELLSITQEDMVKRLKPVTGTLWEILESSTMRKEKLRNKSVHNPQKVRYGMMVEATSLTFGAYVAFFAICQLAFSRNWRANIFQKFPSLYLKGCGIAPRASDALSSLGVTTSQKMGVHRNRPHRTVSTAGVHTGRSQETPHPLARQCEHPVPHLQANDQPGESFRQWNSSDTLHIPSNRRVDVRRCCLANVS